MSEVQKILILVMIMVDAPRLIATTTESNMICRKLLFIARGGNLLRFYKLRDYVLHDST